MGLHGPGGHLRARGSACWASSEWLSSTVYGERLALHSPRCRGQEQSPGLQPAAAARDWLCKPSAGAASGGKPLKDSKPSEASANKTHTSLPRGLLCSARLFCGQQTSGGSFFKHTATSHQQCLALVPPAASHRHRGMGSGAKASLHLGQGPWGLSGKDLPSPDPHHLRNPDAQRCGRSPRLRVQMGCSPAWGARATLSLPKGQRCVSPAFTPGSSPGCSRKHS